MNRQDSDTGRPVFCAQKNKIKWEKSNEGCGQGDFGNKQAGYTAEA